MPSPPEKLAQSLEILHGLQNANGGAAIRAKDMTRTHRERLLASGFLREVMKGRYIPSRPDEAKGESTTGYAAFWTSLPDLRAALPKPGDQTEKEGLRLFPLEAALVECSP